MRFGALLFDFDGVLIESEALGNREIADWLTAAGHPTTPADAMRHFTGLAGADFHAAVERWVAGPLPPGFQEARVANNRQALAAGIEAVAGAIDFVRSLPASLPKAIVSSSSTHWIATHLGHLGLADAFGDRLYSGREHVSRGKPAPDLYLYAADRLGVDITRCAILEDSAVGATGAVASGGFVIGLVAGTHCDAAHAERLRGLGVSAVATDFDQVASLIGM